MSNGRGRPKKEAEKRDQFLRLRFTKTELAAIKQETESLGTSISDYSRSKVLNGKSHKLNGLKLIASLDSIGTELGRSGNNINQLAKQANSLNKVGKVDETIMSRFNTLFADYIKAQLDIQTAIRAIIREVKG